jgi:hypothetical protein
VRKRIVWGASILGLLVSAIVLAPIGCYENGEPVCDSAAGISLGFTGVLIGPFILVSLAGALLGASLAWFLTRGRFQAAREAS